MYNMSATSQMQDGGTDSTVTVAEMMRLLICSDLRKNLILALRNGSATLANLREATGASSTAAIHALRELEKERLTYQDAERNYLLTNTGSIVAFKLESFAKAINVITEYGKFWYEHDLSGIPQASIENIGWLEESHLLTSTPTDVFKVFSTFVTLLENSKLIKGVSPIFTPDLVEIFAKLAEKGIPIELIVTREVLEKMLELADRSALKNALGTNLKVFVIEQNPKTAFTVTDYFFTIGLWNRLDESYDYSDELVTYTEEGIRWGREIFDYYMGLSKEFDLAD